MECENAPNANESSSIIVFGMFHNFIILAVATAVVVVFLTLLFALQFFGLYFNFHIILGWKWQPLSLLPSPLPLKSPPRPVVDIMVVFKIHESFTFFYFARLPRRPPTSSSVVFMRLFLFLNFNVYIRKRSSSNDCTNIIYGCTLDVQFTYKYSQAFSLSLPFSIIFFCEMCISEKRVKTNLPYCFV